MGQQDIGTGRQPGIPFIKVTRHIRQRIVGGLVDEEQRQQYTWRKENGKPVRGELAFKENGKPLLELVLTLVVMPGTSATMIDEDGVEVVPEPGTVVRHSIDGFKWGQYIKARDLLGKDNNPRTGDLFAQTYAHASIADGFENRTILATEAEIAAVPRDVNIRKDMEILVRRPGPEHTAIVEQCNAKRAELAQQPVGASVGGAPAGGGYNPATDDPF